MLKKKIFICEYVTGGGYFSKKIPSRLFLQGENILYSLLKDFNNIPNLEVYYSWDKRFKKKIHFPKIKCFQISKSPWNKWGEIIKKCDFFFPIAPETENSLYNLIKFGKKFKKKIISSDLKTIEVTSSKYKTYEKLKKGGIYTIPTYKKLIDVNFLTSKLWVAKPDDGAGSEDIFIIKDRNKLKFFLNKKFLIQPYLKGNDFSVNILKNKKNYKILNINKQKITLKREKIQFNGTKFTKQIVFNSLLRKKIKKVMNLFPGLKGFLGIDFILFNKKIYIVDINPRITTSYAGLSKKIKTNIGMQILKIFDCSYK